MLKINRKLYHLGGLIFPLIVLVFSRKYAVILSGSLFMAILCIDIMRLKWKGFNFWVLKNMPFMFKSQEVKNISASPFYIGGVFLALLLFRPEYATAGIICLSIGDLSAVIVGRNFGRINIFNKTLEGTLAFFLVTVVVMLTLKSMNIFFVYKLSTEAIVLGSLICALVEVLPVRIDDNLTIPIIGAFVFRLFS